QECLMLHIETADVWFTGSIDEQIANFEGKFEELIGKVQGPVVMDVNGHKFEMLKRTESATWFTFEEACCKARSSSDFIRLAECFETVFFHGLPKLTRDLVTEARRFVIIVDEFYD